MSVTLPWKASRDTPVNGVADKLDEVRRSLSKQAEDLADMAADYTRQASAHATDVATDTAHILTNTARDASSQASDAANEHASNASSFINDLLKAVAALGTAVALSGRKTAQDLGDNASAMAKDVGHNAQSIAKDLSKVRLTTEPKKTGPDFAPGITLLAGFGAGIALMYFFDPERGRARRNLLRDKIMAGSRRASDSIQQMSTQMRGQMSTNAESDTDTESWRPRYGDGGEYASGDSQFGGANPDGSTTDTWGTQPQREASTI